MVDDREQLIRAATVGRTPGTKGWIRANCPFCEDRTGKADRKQAFGFHVKYLRYECYRCGARGRLRGGFAEFSDFEPAEVEERLSLDPPESFVPLSSEDARRSLFLGAALEYLERRGVTPSVIDRAGIGACTGGRFAGRVIIPVKDDDGAWVWYVGRTWGPSERPYLYPRGDRRGVMFHQAALGVKTDTPAMIVEGCFDALAVWPDGVAVLGKPTEENVESFLAAARPVALVLDGDAHREGWAIAYRLRLHGQRAGSVRLPPRIDPDEVPLQELRDAAVESLASGEVIL